MDNEDQEYAAAFDEDMRPPQEDDGADVDDEATEQAAEGAAPEIEPGQTGGGSEAQPAVAVVLGADKQAEDPEIEKERQRLRSWEGRLKAREAELAGKGAGDEASDKLEDVADSAAAGGNQQLADAANAAAEAVEAGEISAEDAMKQLTEDFGEDFVKMVTAVVRVAARKEVEPLASTVEEVVGNLNSREAREHFSTIASKHPDFQEIGKSPEFVSFIDSLPDDQKAEAARIKERGSAKEVIALIDAYKSKSTKPGPAEADTQAVESEMDGMEGVRSGGVRLPSKPPPAADDFAGAWEQF